jgi:hypothetical protein
MSSSFKRERERTALRRRLQVQREIIARRLANKDLFSPRHVQHLLEPADTFPRSITMRLLANRQNFLLLAVAEIFPLLVRHFLKNAAQDQQRKREWNDEPP